LLGYLHNTPVITAKKKYQTMLNISINKKTHWMPVVCKTTHMPSGNIEEELLIFYFLKFKIEIAL
jgi:hypothetical protein